MNQNHNKLTLFDKIWANHLVDRQEDGTCLIYIDRHLVHEVTSPQAFEGLRNNNDALTGSSFVPPPNVLIADELESLIEWWERPTLMHPFEKIVLFHH